MKRLSIILFVGLGLITLSATTPALEHRVFLPVVMNGFRTLSCWAENNSYFTTCAEEDNINVPIFAQNINRFQVVATHPTYNVGVDNCNADFSGCGSSANFKAAQTDPCFDDPSNKIYDDQVNNALWACPEPNWWRPFSMNVLVGGEQRTVQRLVWIRKNRGSKRMASNLSSI